MMIRVRRTHWIFVCPSEEDGGCRDVFYRCKADWEMTGFLPSGYRNVVWETRAGNEDIA